MARTDHPASATALQNVNGPFIERDGDGMIHGEPVVLTGEQRQVLPPLSSEPAHELQHGTATGMPMIEVLTDASGVATFDMSRGHVALASEPDISGAAKELAERITAARAAGYRVQMPFMIEQLGMITVSATAKALGEAVTHKLVMV